MFTILVPLNFVVFVHPIVVVWQFTHWVSRFQWIAVRRETSFFHLIIRRLKLFLINISLLKQTSFSHLRYDFLLEASQTIGLLRINCDYEGLCILIACKVWVGNTGSCCATLIAHNKWCLVWFCLRLLSKIHFIKS